MQNDPTHLWHLASKTRGGMERERVDKYVEKEREGGRERERERVSE